MLKAMMKRLKKLKGRKFKKLICNYSATQKIIGKFFDLLYFSKKFENARTSLSVFLKFSQVFQRS